MKTFVIIGNNVVQDTFIKAGLYTFNATIKSHLTTHRIGFKGASGWVDVELPTNPNKFTKAHAIFELKEDVTQISLCRSGASTTNPIIVQTPMWTEGNNISTPSPNPDDLDETTSNVDIKLSTQILQTNEKIQLIATEEQFDEIGQGGVTAFGMIKVMAGDIELKVGKDGVISAINLSEEEIKINADRIRFTGSAEFENAVKDISPDAIIIEVGIPYYEFKKAEGSPYAEYEELNIPVYANIGDNRAFLNVGAITSNTNITGLSIQQVEANKVRITAQSNLSASAGTVILSVEVRGKKYLADFNFKVIEKPRDGTDGKDGTDGTDGENGENGRYLSIKGDVLINNPTQSSGVLLRRELFGMSDETLTVWQYRNSSGSLVNFASPYLKQQSINYNSTYFTDGVCEVKCFVRDEPNIYDTLFIHVVRDGKDGEDGINGKYLSIKGNVLIHNPTSSSSVRLTRELFGTPESTLVVWQYRNSSGTLVNFSNPYNIIQDIGYNSTYFTNDICEVKCFIRDEPNIYDIHFIHVTRDGKDGEDGRDGVDGKGISIKGSVDNYNQLLGLTGLSAGDAYFNESDGKLYIWDGFNFPQNGQGILFQGEAGKDGEDGLNGVSISSLIQQYINHDSKTVQPDENANWLDKMPKYEDGLYMWSRFKMTLSNGQVQYSSYSLLEDFEAMKDSARIKNLIIYGDFSGVMKEIKSSNPVNYYPLGWRVSGLSHDSNGVPSDQNNIAPRIFKINTGLPKGMLAGLRITPKTNLQGIYQNLSSDLVLNEVHTAYVFARKRNASSVAQIRLKYGSIMVTEDLTTTWARYVLKFTPTSQQPFEILFNKTGTWTANDMVEISKIQLAQTELIFDYRQFSYIENAFAGSTSIEGGVVATRMVILSNEGGEIRSYVSGIDANPYAFAAGVTGFGTDLEKRNIGIKHDGTLIAKNADIEGEVSATGGKIGGFSLENMGLLSQNNRFFIDALNGAIYLLDENGDVKTSIIPYDLPSTPEAFFAGSGGGSLSLTDLQGSYDDGQTKTTGSFTVDVSGGKQFSLLIPEIKGSVSTDYTAISGGGGASGSSATTIYFELMRSSKVHLVLGQAIVFSTGGLMSENFTIQQRTIQISSSGVYSLRARVETNVTPSNHSATGGASVSIISPSAEFIAVVNRSQIGNNGMIIASSTTRYDFMVGDKHIIRRGKYGFRVTEDGLQKSNNMNASTPTWRNIEQPF